MISQGQLLKLLVTSNLEASFDLDLRGLAQPWNESILEASRQNIEPTQGSKSVILFDSHIFLLDQTTGHITKRV